MCDDSVGISPEIAGLLSGIDRDLRHGCRYIEAIDRHTLRGVMPQLTPARYHALAASLIAHSVGQVARQLACDPGNATGLVDWLAQHGLVTCTYDSADRRRVIVNPTAAGRLVFATATQARMAALSQAVDHAAIARLAALSRHLQWFLDELQHVDAEAVE